MCKWILFLYDHLRDIEIRTEYFATSLKLASKKLHGSSFSARDTSTIMRDESVKFGGLKSDLLGDEKVKHLGG